MSEKLELTIPHGALVVLIGPSGVGKSTFANRHFSSTEILSADVFRAYVSDDANNQSASRAAFDIVHFIARVRLGRRRLTVIDATNVLGKARKPLLELAFRRRAVAVAIVFDLPQDLCKERNGRRTDRTVPDNVIEEQYVRMKRSLERLESEGFRYVYRLTSAEEIDEAVIKRIELRYERPSSESEK
jgi:protein phosphatase